MRSLFLYGSGGHAKVVLDLLDRQGQAVVEFLVDDDPAAHGGEVLGMSAGVGRPQQGIRR